MRCLLILSAATLAPLALGCSGSDEPLNATGPGAGSGNAYTDEYACVTPPTGYDGDDLCIRPPAPEDGFQLHYGPKDYTAEEIAKFVLGPGEELTDCMFFSTPNDTEVFYQDYHARARSGTHHIIVYAGGTAGDGEEGTLGRCDFGADMSFMVGAQAGVGAKGVVLDVPLPGAPTAPENVDLGYRLVPRRAVAFQMHYVNTHATKSILREGWVNFHYKDAAKVKVVADPIFFIGGFGMAVQPNTHVLVRAGQSKNCTIPENGPEEIRILGISGHMHSHAVRFAAYKNTLAGEKQLIYQTFDWSEPLNAQFASNRTYDAPDPVTKNEGALSGVQIVKKGESIEWECEYVNNDDFVLNFANGAYTAEMCNLFGYYAPSLGGEPWRCYNVASPAGGEPL